MPSDNAATEVVSYGPGVGTEAEYRLLGHVAGKRVLELGCGEGQASVVFAKQGATAIAVDSSADQLAQARRGADRADVRIELHHGDLADLAFVRADSVDLVFSAWAFQFVDDLNRVFRQVHRVLKTGAIFVFSLPHPVAAMVDSDEPPVIRRSYFDRGLLASPSDEDGGVVTYPHTVQDVFMGLGRTGFRVDTLLEPEGRGHAAAGVPGTLVVRARKEGS